MKRLVVYIVIIMNLLLMASCESNDVDKTIFEATEIEISKETLNEEPIEVKAEEIKVSDEGNTIELTEDFSSEFYYQGGLYSIAPSEISDKDMDRPDNNSEWIKLLNIIYPQLYNMEDGKKKSVLLVSSKEGSLYER